MSKGDSFEREMCRTISLWWTDGERDDVFWRNRTRVTSNTPNAERQLGDLSTVHTEGVPFVEVFNTEFKIGYSKTKKGKKHKIIPWDLLDIIDGKGKVFQEFWEQTHLDALASKRIPLLIFKRDYHSPVVAIYSKDIQRMEDISGLCTAFPFLSVTLIDYDKIELHNFVEFFAWLDPQTVKLLAVKKKMPLKIVSRTKDDPDN